MTKFRLTSDETLDEGVKRIIRGLADEAQAELRVRDRSRIVDSVHETRKLCKKARGLMRLVRPALGEEFSTANRLFRDAARELAPIRDPQALLRTFDALMAVPELGPDAGFPAVRRSLAKRSADATEAVAGSESPRLDKASQLIAAGRARTVTWEIPNSFDPIRGGVSRTYRRGRSQLSLAADSRSPEVFHEWRKRVKYLWYQMRLLRNSAPSVLRPLARRLHDLSDGLGDAHDLQVMDRVLVDVNLPESERNAFGTLTAGMRVRLEDRAMSLGRRLFVEEPPAFADRLEGFWDAWQEGEELAVGGITDLFGVEGDQARAEPDGASEQVGSFIDRPGLISSLRAGDTT